MTDNLQTKILKLYVRINFSNDRHGCNYTRSTQQKSALYSTKYTLENRMCKKCSHLSLFDVLLFVDFSQTQFALLLVEGACPGVVKWLLLWLDTPLYIVPCLATVTENTNLDTCAYGTKAYIH